jgi:hypothetical protein
MPMIVEPCGFALSELGPGIAASLARLTSGSGYVSVQKRIKLVGPIPVYSCAAEDFLKNADQPLRLVAWRGLVMSPDDHPIGCVSLNPRADRSCPDYSVRGEEAGAALAGVLEEATRFTAGGGEKTVLRFVTFDSLYVTAVWLASTEHHFIPTRSGRGRRPGPAVLTSEAFLALVRARLDENRRSATGSGAQLVG